MFAEGDMEQVRFSGSVRFLCRAQLLYKILFFQNLCRLFA